MKRELNSQKFLGVRAMKKVRVKNCLKCGHQVILKKGFFLCEACRKANSQLQDFGNIYQSHLAEKLRTFRLQRHRREISEELEKIYSMSEGESGS
jgi:hypothetical protein